MDFMIVKHVLLQKQILNILDQVNHVISIIEILNNTKSIYLYKIYEMDIDIKEISFSL